MGQDMRVHGTAAQTGVMESDMPGQTSQFNSAPGFKSALVRFSGVTHTPMASKQPGAKTSWNDGSTQYNGMTFQSKSIPLPESDIVRPVTVKMNMSSLVESFQNGYLKGE